MPVAVRFALGLHAPVLTVLWQEAHKKRLKSHGELKTMLDLTSGDSDLIEV